MINIDLKHLFTPGTGGVPPYLAGRKREQEYFQDCVETLKNRRPISQNLDQLYQLGYVWRVDRLDYEAGIPSLMSYIQGYSQPREQQPAAPIALEPLSTG